MDGESPRNICLVLDVVRVDIQKENGKWYTYTSNRNGKEDFVNVHGTNKYKDTDRNFIPGKYKVRIIYYFDEPEKGVMLEKSVIIPNYVDGKKDN